MSNDYTKIAIQLEKFGKVQGLMRYINYANIKSQHDKQMKNKATGIDKISKKEYEENLKENIEELISQMKTFSYKPLPVRRVYIPKEGSDKTRPLGIPAYRDKIVQGAFAEVLNEIYENIFLECSYGFRPKRSCHDAIKELDKIIKDKRVNYIVDADIKGFFNNLDQEWLIKFLEYTIQDKHFIRYIKRFLRSGIMEEGKKIESDKGTPQRRINKPNTSKCILALCIRFMDRKRHKEKIQR